MMTDSTTSTGIITLDTRSTPLRTPAKMMARVNTVNTTKQISADSAAGDKGGEIAVRGQLAAVAADVLGQILDDPAADDRVIGHDQDGDDGVDPAAEANARPCRTAANAPTGLFLVIRPSAVSATIMV